jgi:hypothetical protein
VTKRKEKPNVIGQQPEPEPSSQPHRVRLPGFLNEEEIGLGDAIKRVTYAMGIRPCGGCNRRAAALNRWMTLTR